MVRHRGAGWLGAPTHGAGRRCSRRNGFIPSATVHRVQLLPYTWRSLCANARVQAFNEGDCVQIFDDVSSVMSWLSSYDPSRNTDTNSGGSANDLNLGDTQVSGM